MADEVVEILRAGAIRGASAIHLEPWGAGYRVRARIGGVLEPLRELTAARGLEAIAKLRSMSGMDLDRNDIEAGRMTVQLPEGRFGFSVTVTVGARGDVATVYVQAPRGTPYFPDFTFEALGLIGDDRARMERALARPGIVILAGPTRSGKQPMLYAALRTLAADRKVLSVEWVIREKLDGIHQVQVDDARGLHFSSLLRAAPQLDADVVGVGELIDFETTEIAFRLAGRGLTIVTTLHVNRAVDAFRRLTNMGVDPWLVAESVTLVQAQRRIRGHLLVESLEVTPPIADAIRDGKPPPLTGLKTLRQRGLALADAGVVSRGDVLRHTPEDG